MSNNFGVNPGNETRIKIMEGRVQTLTQKLDATLAMLKRNQRYTNSAQVFQGIVGSTTAAGMTGLVSIDDVSYSATNHSNCTAVPGDFAFVGLNNGIRFYTLCKCCTVASCCDLSLTFCIAQQEEVIPVDGGFAVFDVSSFCSACTIASLKITLACNAATEAITGTWELNCDGVVTTGSIAEDLDLLCDPDNDVTLDGLITSADCSLAFVAGNITGICVSLACRGDYCLEPFACQFNWIGQHFDTPTYVCNAGLSAKTTDLHFETILSADVIDWCEGVPYTITYTVENLSGVVRSRNGFGLRLDLGASGLFRSSTIIAITPEATSVGASGVIWEGLSYSVDETKTFTITFLPGPIACPASTPEVTSFVAFHSDTPYYHWPKLRFRCEECVDCNCVKTPTAPEFMLFNNYPTEVAAVTGFSITIEAVTTTFGPRQTWDLRATVLSTSLSAQTLDQLNMTAPVLGIPTTATGATIVGGGQTSRWASQAFAPGETKIFTTTFTNLSLGCPGAAAAFATVEAIHGASTAAATAEYRCV